MKCPFCGNRETKVIDSRETEDGSIIRRRRECMRCKKRFSTYERIELGDIIVIKKDGRREPYNRKKLMTGISKACEKRPISYDKINSIIEAIEQKIRSKFITEVPSKFIGDQVMNYLKKLDEVAYIRFASVYRQFKDITRFEKELKKLQKG